MADKLVTIAEFANNVEAQMTGEALELEGIEYFIADEHIASIAPHLTHVVGGIKLRVKESDAEKAKKILEDTVS